jgi:NAD(P)-dependent dehydrogenase (short-subunit alcohol dehydrogenase family)
MSGHDAPVALVTGAGSGMGFATALHLASRGFRVFGSVLNDTEAAALEDGAARRDVRVRTVRMDITRPEDAQQVVSTILAEAGRIDALVNFAGLGLRGFFEDLDLDEIRRVFEINVFGAMALLQAVVPRMRRARGGRIVLTTSIAGRIGSMGIGGYASSKFAVEGLGECLAQELAPFGIHVSLLEPGLVLTEHFTRHRNRARRALDPAGPYYAWFCQHERIVDDLLARGTFTPADVARLVERILLDKRPLLRYVVGRKARLVLTLRRYIPGELFERLYWRMVRRIVTDPRRPTPALSEGGPPQVRQGAGETR